MIPALLVLGVGRRLWPIPVPVILLWPFALLLLGGISLVSPFLPHGTLGSRIRKVRAALMIFFHLAGLKIEVWDGDDSRVRIRFI